MTSQKTIYLQVRFVDAREKEHITGKFKIKVKHETKMRRVYEGVRKHIGRTFEIDVTTLQIWAFNGKVGNYCVIPSDNSS